MMIVNKKLTSNIVSVIEELENEELDDLPMVKLLEYHRKIRL
jgi:hypothetical protein